VISHETPLALGSASPRRRELLTSLRIPLVIVAAAVDEGRLSGEAAGPYLDRVVASKLRAAREAALNVPCSAVLVADTIVLLGEDVLGKPASTDDARAMLTRLSGREHEVRTRFAIAGARPGVEYAQTVGTRVWFRALLPREIAAYAATGEGLDKAGSYAIQGLGSFAVAGLAGSYTNVVGLPVCEVVVALRDLGLLDEFP
jgi:septum formation protein